MGFIKKSNEDCTRKTEVYLSDPNNLFPPSNSQPVLLYYIIHAINIMSYKAYLVKKNSVSSKINWISFPQHRTLAILALLCLEEKGEGRDKKKEQRGGEFLGCKN